MQGVTEKNLPAGKGRKGGRLGGWKGKAILDELPFFLFVSHNVFSQAVLAASDGLLLLRSGAVDSGVRASRAVVASAAGDLGCGSIFVPFRQLRDLVVHDDDDFLVRVVAAFPTAALRDYAALAAAIFGQQAAFAAMTAPMLAPVTMSVFVAVMPVIMPVSVTVFVSMPMFVPMIMPVPVFVSVIVTKPVSMTMLVSTAFFHAEMFHGNFFASVSAAFFEAVFAIMLNVVFEAVLEPFFAQTFVDGFASGACALLLMRARGFDGGVAACRAAAACAAGDLRRVGIVRILAVVDEDDALYSFKRRLGDEVFFVRIFDDNDQFVSELSSQ